MSNRLEKFGPGIWISDGETVSVAGFHYPTRTVLIRLSDGSLLVWSPIALRSELRSEVDRLGEIAHIVAPNSLHHLFLQEWIAAYPKALVYAPPRLAKKRGDLSFDIQLDAGVPAAFKETIDFVIVEGNAITTEVVFFHYDSNTVIFTDLLQQFPDDWFSGWRKLIAKMDRMVSPLPSVPRKFQMAFTNCRKGRNAISQVLNWPISNVIVAHGTPVRGNGHQVVEQAFEWLIKR